MVNGVLGKFKHMPEAMWPREIDHVEYSEVYRATKSEDVLAVVDFLPWNVEYEKQRTTFRNTFKQPEYGMSVFTDLNDLKRTVCRFPALNKSTKAFARGFTTIKRGVSLRENQNHHVEYYLYDYENNSPKDDFTIVEVRSEHEK